MQRDCTGKSHTALDLNGPNALPPPAREGREALTGAGQLSRIGPHGACMREVVPAPKGTRARPAAPVRARNAAQEALPPQLARQPAEGCGKDASDANGAASVHQASRGPRMALVALTPAVKALTPAVKGGLEVESDANVAAGKQQTRRRRLAYTRLAPARPRRTERHGLCE